MSYQTCIKDREAEIEKLRNQVQISTSIVFYVNNNLHLVRFWHYFALMLKNSECVCVLWSEHDQVNEFIHGKWVGGSSENSHRESHPEADDSGNIEHSEELAGLTAGETRGERLRCELELIVSTCTYICTTCGCFYTLYIRTK